MRRLLTLILLASCVSVSYAQVDSTFATAEWSATVVESDITDEVWWSVTFSDSTDYAKPDSAALKICNERGHVDSGWGMVTLMSTSDRLVDEDDRALLIHFDPNTYEYQCKRCHAWVREPVQAHPDTTVIWKRQKEN